MNEYCNVININTFGETSIDVIQEEHAMVGYKPVRLKMQLHICRNIHKEFRTCYTSIMGFMTSVCVFLAGMINLFKVIFSFPFFL